MNLFLERDCRFVPFVEAGGLERIGLQTSDPAIEVVELQARTFRATGCEFGLHLHPQWYNAQYHEPALIFDYREYKLCALSPDRSEEIVAQSLRYLRGVMMAKARLEKAETMLYVSATGKSLWRVRRRGAAGRRHER